jgi:hypothetical protein
MISEHGEPWWWCRLEITPDSSPRALWQSVLPADTSGASRRNGRWSENFACQYLKYFKDVKTCHKILRHSPSGFTSHPKESVLRIFIALKNPSPLPVWTRILGFYVLIQSVNRPVAGFPMVASFPHFLAADPSLRDHVAGMLPDKEKHSGYVNVEPVSTSAITTWGRSATCLLTSSKNLLLRCQKVVTNSWTSQFLPAKQILILSVYLRHCLKSMLSKLTYR